MKSGWWGVIKNGTATFTGEWNSWHFHIRNISNIHVMMYSYYSTAYFYHSFKHEHFHANATPSPPRKSSVRPSAILLYTYTGSETRGQGAVRHSIKRDPKDRWNISAEGFRSHLKNSERRQRWRWGDDRL